MRIVIAPDSFKECITAGQVAAAISEGVIEACPQAVIDICPMADGGEGTVPAIVTATGGRYISADVFDPLGKIVRAKYALVSKAPEVHLPGEVGLVATWVDEADHENCACDGCLAVVEMAAASGLELVPPSMRDPLHTTTYGTGQLITSALDAGAGEIVLGVGGSATVDGGAGCAAALGVRFLDSAGCEIGPSICGGRLSEIASIDVTGLDSRIRPGMIQIACDVSNPLTGANGAARIYAPQKGATPEVVDMLEAGLENLCEVVQRDLGVDISRLSSAGAAGGLAGGLVAFAGATMHRGFDLIAEAVGLGNRIGQAQLVITGEGKLDAQSAYGKVCAGVAEFAREAGVAVICIPGKVAHDAPIDMFQGVWPLVAEGVNEQQAMNSPESLLTLRARQAMQRYMRTMLNR